MIKEYKETYQFGKVSNFNGHRRNLVELEVKLKIKDDKIVFTATGGVWNGSHTDYIRCGQCIDGVYNEHKGELQNRKTYEAIMALWEKWHLNDTHDECEHQEKLGWNWETNPSAICPTCGYVLGSAWTYRKISGEDLNEIMSLLHLAPLEQITIRRMNERA